MRVLDFYVDARTGERGERWIEVPGVITEAEAIELSRIEGIRAANQAIRDRLADNDKRITRALVEFMLAPADDNRARIQAHKQAQEDLRAQIKPEQ